MRKLTCFLVLCFMLSKSHGQERTQSIIYDATSIMNAKYGVEGLLVPTATGFNLYNSTTGELQPEVANVPAALIAGGQSNAVIYEILRRNAGLPVGTPDATIIAAYSSNPFLNDIITRAVPAGKLPLLRSVENFQLAAPSAGLGQDVLGNLVNGTADFLIKRAQEEISIAVFEKLKAFIDQYPEFDKLFPRTCSMIKPIEAYEYNKALTAFKAAIQDDLKMFISRISSLYSIPRYKLLNEKVPSLTLVFSASTLLSELNGEQNFAGSIKALGEQEFLTERNNYAGFLKVSAVLSNSLLDKLLSDEENKQPQYIHREFVKKVTHNDVALMALLSRIYLGLVWQHTQNINFTTGGTTSTFAALLNHWATNATIERAIKSVDQTLTIVQTIDEKLKQLKVDEATTVVLTSGSNVKAKRFVLYSEIINGALGLTELYINPANANVSNHIREIRKAWPSCASLTNEMIKDFQSGEYNLGISKLEEVLKVVEKYLDAVEDDKASATALSDEFKLKLEAQKRALEAEKRIVNGKLAALPAPTGDAEMDANLEADRQFYKEEISKIDEQIKDVDHQLKNRKTMLFSMGKIIRCTNLLASVTKAENSAAVEALLESYALPAGSSRIKKVTDFNIAINAYVGGFFGRNAFNDDEEEGEGFTNTYGFTAPIGVTISHGFKKWGSGSIFLGVFDIGGTIRYKLDNQGKYQQDISLAGIVSPSVQLVYGFPFYLPLSIGAGCQWISPTTSESSKIELRPHFNAFVGVDIPLFNLTGRRLSKN